ncbi:hypothetical protein EVAR_76816_1 [Eumeta japonica]|uniref:Uncharacterized protein n=1 Tax=Eumeta variegata TaxID=151549 RepID=A0A4C1STZ3_EUMVA|nr:hypothetical protein EVAR_76816_1 [Eumeta japonica]
MQNLVPSFFTRTTEHFDVITKGYDVDDATKLCTLNAMSAKLSVLALIPVELARGTKTHYELSVRPDARGVSDSHGLKTPCLPLARRLFRLYLSGQKALGSANGAKRSVSGVRKLRERSLGAETVRRLGVQTAGSPECVAGTDARGLTAAARLTLRGTPHTHIRAEPDTTECDLKEH